MRSLQVRSCASWLAMLIALWAGCGPSASDVSRLRPVDAGPDPDTDADGDGWTIGAGDCNDQDPRIHPGAAILCGYYIDWDCSGTIDEDCDDDHDGYSKAQGDCNDSDPLVNPGAFEIVGNKTDDNCNGIVDEPFVGCDPPTLTTQDPSVAQDATAFAHAIELCEPWLRGARLSPDSDTAGRSLFDHFGHYYKPLAGKSFIYLSSGLAVDRDDPHYTAETPRPGTAFQNTDINPWPIEDVNYCTGLSQPDSPSVFDAQILTLAIKVPTNANGIQFDFNFFSAEYPENVGNQYNDKFVAYLDSAQYKGNISFGKSGQPITVNGGFFQVCQSSSVCFDQQTMQYKKAWACSFDPLNDQDLSKVIGFLDHTGFELQALGRGGELNGGATGWLRTTAPVTPGETITLTFAVYDEGDRFYDSSVLLDNFQWLPDPTALQTGAF